MLRFVNILSQIKQIGLCFIFNHMKTTVNFQRFEVVSRYRDPHPQMVENLNKITY